MHRLTLGDFELTMLSDGGYWLDGGAMFGVVPKPLWEKKFRADEQNRLRLGLNSLLIRTGEHTVLVETGIGNKLGEKPQKIYANEARLLANFDAAKISPEDVDVVINTHLHFDHCGWNTMRQGGNIVPTFPRATYYAPEGEWRHGLRQYERDRVSYLSDNYNPLVESGQMELVTGDREIVPGVSVRVYPGHTATMQAVFVESQGKTACYISDLIPTTAHLDLTWVMGYDLYPLETIANRKRFYESAVPNNWLVVFTHDPATPWAYIESKGEGKYGARSAETGEVIPPITTELEEIATRLAD
ncbi:MAG TPA: MBL fold metallo-hydrolase [Terriglobales bacterium]|nr:MBL fold metallo-hydrolase [Terriglobales bacterium]